MHFPHKFDISSKLTFNILPNVCSGYQCTIESCRFDLQTYAHGNALQCLQPLATSNFPIYLNLLLHALYTAISFRLFHIFVCAVHCGSFDGNNKCMYVSLTGSENGMKNSTRQCGRLGGKEWLFEYVFLWVNKRERRGEKRMGTNFQRCSFRCNRFTV